MSYQLAQVIMIERLFQTMPMYIIIQHIQVYMFLVYMISVCYSIFLGQIEYEGREESSVLDRYHREQRN